jgi:hypothetical protein
MTWTARVIGRGGPGFEQFGGREGDPEQVVQPVNVLRRSASS